MNKIYKIDNAIWRASGSFISGGLTRSITLGCATQTRHKVDGTIRWRIMEDTHSTIATTLAGRPVGMFLERFSDNIGRMVL